MPYRTEPYSTAQNISSGAGAPDHEQPEARVETGEGLGKSEDGNGQAGKAEVGSAETGTARVRRILIEPMAGLARGKRVTEAQHRDNLDRLARKLSYMDAAGLQGLVELVLAHAGQLARGRLPVCPEVGVVLAWAYALQAPPVRQSDYAASVMRSAMGRRAHDGGYGVELLRHARRHGPPPGAYSVFQLQDEARENLRRRRAIRDSIEAGGSVSPEHARWLQGWHDDAALVEGLISEGDDRRAARGDAA